MKLYMYMLNHVVIEIRPGMAVKCGFKSESMNYDFSRIITEGLTIPEIVFSKYIFVLKRVWSSDSSRIARD